MDGTIMTSVTAPVVSMPENLFGCADPNYPDLTGKIALISRGGPCASFYLKGTNEIREREEHSVPTHILIHFDAIDSTIG